MDIVCWRVCGMLIWICGASTSLVFVCTLWRCRVDPPCTYIYIYMKWRVAAEWGKESKHIESWHVIYVSLFLLWRWKCWCKNAHGMYHAKLVAWAVDASCQNRQGSMTSVGASLTSMLYSPAGFKFATRRLNVALQSWKLENIEQFEHAWKGKVMPQIWSRRRKPITWMMEVGGWNLPGCAFKTPWLGPQKGSARTMERLALLKACVPGAFKVFTAVGHENGLDYDDVQTLQVPWCVWKPRAWMKSSKWFIQ